MILFLASTVAALACALAAGPMSLTLLNNRRLRESAETFWWGFWQYLGPLDTPFWRFSFALVVAVGILLTYQRGWTSFPGALTLMAIAALAASNSFGHVRIEMVLPLGVFLLRTIRGQLIYLTSVILWSLVPLYDFFRYGSIFADADVSPFVYSLLVVYTNAPLLLILCVWLCAIPWRSLTTALTRPSIFEPNALSRFQRQAPPDIIKINHG